MTLDRFINFTPKENREKVSRLKEVLSELGVDCARRIEERVDLQFDALRNLHKNLGNDELFLKLVLANSVVSYQLSGKGEDWWWEFSRYFSGKPPEGEIWKAYSEFLSSSRTNRRLVAGKIGRLKKLEPFLTSLSLDELREYYTRGMVKLRDDIARTLGSKKSAKTIVFAVKMFGYAGRIAFGEFVPYTIEIEIPDDVRINAYTRRFTDEKPVLFWARIARETEIPPLHIDSILWPVLGGKKEVLRRLERHCGERAKLILELTKL
ncbi:N-glycosylase [Thermococcus profundus]|uniref:N-glycosylase/DNA lyase n=1 Tax=Thermococcus profundus TaxID=49899 RepID=A0A2Z2MJX9_THEPR|nr:N-glycosylase/DNA lyase [Thermococcus profundus]ASJ02731.1 N-glycosylase [Thermococcus profundus]